MTLVDLGETRCSACDRVFAMSTRVPAGTHAVLALRCPCGNETAFRDHSKQPPDAMALLRSRILDHERIGAAMQAGKERLSKRLVSSRAECAKLQAALRRRARQVKATRDDARVGRALREHHVSLAITPFGEWKALAVDGTLGIAATPHAAVDAVLALLHIKGRLR